MTCNRLYKRAGLRRPVRAEGLVSLLAAALAIACSTGPGSDDGDHSDESGDEESEPQVEPAQAPNLQWKRASALEQDLMRALELEADQVCLEVGTAPCISEVHQVALGGHDPFDLGLYESLDAPLTTSPIALDRVVLSACGNRVALDRQGSALVFDQLALDEPAPSAEDERVAATITALYRRLLARDPLPSEIELVAGLTVDDQGEPVAGHEFASLACYTIGTTSEFLFF